MDFLLRRNKMGNEENNNNEVNTDQQNENVKTGQNVDNGNQNDKSGSDSSGEKTFTQTEVNKMMAREKQQGRSSAYKELGIDPSDTNTVSMFKAFIEAQKTTEQKANEQKAESDAKLAQAEEKARIAEAKATALKLGVKSECVDDVVALAITKVTDDNDVDSIINDFKSKYSFWFTDSEDDDSENSVGKKGTGSSISGKKTSSKGSDSVKGIGKRLAAARKTSNAKKSYWK